jgi:hypothetical protein
VEKVAKSLWSLQYLTPYETDANSSAKIEFRAIAEGLIDLISADVRPEALDDAAVVFDRYENDPFTAAVVADHLRRMKGDT